MQALEDRSDEIIRTDQISVIADILQETHPDTTLFLDVDETLITPASKMFRTGSPFYNLIDDIRANPDRITNFEELLGNWRLKRKSILVSEHWPKLIQDWLGQNRKVYALTQVDTGTVGPISSMEEWRFQELSSKGIKFCRTFRNQNFCKILGSSQGREASFYHGIFLTGSHKKSNVVSEYLKAITPAKIILIDDRESQILDLAALCQDQNIPYLGIIFRGVDQLLGMPDPNVANLQIQYLLDTQEWLEDEEAEEKLRSFS